MARSDDSFDLVVVGSGIAGLATALAGAELGLRVVVLEKAEMLGGTTATANTLWVAMNHLQLGAGYEDSREEAIDYMRFVGGDQIIDENMEAFVDEAPKAFRFFEECGVRWRLMMALVDHYYPQAPGAKGIGRAVEAELISEDDLGEFAGTIRVKPDENTNVTQDEVAEFGGHHNLLRWDQELLAERRAKNLRGRGAALVIHFLKQALARGVTVFRGVGAADLVREDGRVVAVITDDGRRLSAAAGVMLATGGYESNPAMMERFESLPGARSMFVPTSEGDGILLGSRLGAGITTIQNNLAALLGFEIPATNGSPETFRLSGIVELLAPHTFVCNGKGRRFADESYFQNLAARLRDFDVGTHAYANWPCYLIFDSQFVEKFSFAGQEPGTEPPSWVARADTPEELAEKLGIDRDGLAETMARFSGFARTGIDGDFDRPGYEWAVAKRESIVGDYVNPSLGAVDRPPFYGVALYSAPFSSAGLTVDGRARVLDYAGEPIPGLFAGGNAAAHSEYGVGYQAGYSLASAMTFGYIAARQAAADRAPAATPPAKES